MQDLNFNNFEQVQVLFNAVSRLVSEDLVLLLLLWVFKTTTDISVEMMFYANPIPKTSNNDVNWSICANTTTFYISVSIDVSKYCWMSDK